LLRADRASRLSAGNPPSINATFQLVTEAIKLVGQGLAPHLPVRLDSAWSTVPELEAPAFASKIEVITLET
jgi:hypothetical protein